MEFYFNLCYFFACISGKQNGFFRGIKTLVFKTSKVLGILFWQTVTSPNANILSAPFLVRAVNVVMFHFPFMNGIFFIKFIIGAKDLSKSSIRFAVRINRSNFFSSASTRSVTGEIASSSSCFKKEPGSPVLNIFVKSMVSAATKLEGWPRRVLPPPNL